MKVLVSNNSEVLRHLATSSFRNLPLEVLAATGGREAIEVADRERPAMCLLDAEMADLSGYQVARHVKNADPACRVVLILGMRVTADQMRQVAECGCDEVLIAPMASDQLFDVIAIQLGVPRRGATRYDINLAVVGHQGERAIEGRVTNLSVDGARLLLGESIPEGAELRVDIRPENESPLAIAARVIWAQRRDAATVVGASFGELPPEARRRLARLTQWEIVERDGRSRIFIKGDLTEATHFDDLLPALVGGVDFDLSQVTYMNSLGVREWVDFLRRAPIRGYRFHACSVAFVLQASLVEGVLGSGTVSSFFAPYACEQCDHAEERLLQTQAVLASEDHQPPVFGCPCCDGLLVLDDIPERYLAFLRPGGADG